MKIRNIGPSQPPKVQEKNPADKTDKAGKNFSEVLGTENKSQVSSTSAPSAGAGAQATGSVIRPQEIRELAQAYRTGNMTRKELTTHIVERIAERLPGLSASAKSRLTDRLTTLIEQDPSLVARMDRIDRLASKS